MKRPRMLLTTLYLSNRYPVVGQFFCFKHKSAFEII